MHVGPADNSHKVGSIPTPERILAVRKLLGDELAIVGGLGGIYFFDEIPAGGNGTMTCFAEGVGLIIVSFETEPRFRELF